MPAGNWTADEIRAMVDKYAGQMPENIYGIYQRFYRQDAFITGAERADLQNFLDSVTGDPEVSRAVLEGAAWLKDPGRVAGQLGKGWEAELESIGTRLSRQGTEGSDATGAAADKAAGDNINAQLQTFINQMSGTVSPNDPIYKALTMYGDAKASSNAAMAGLGQTGMAMAAGQQGGQQAAVPYLQARSGMALQGMNALSQRDLGLRQNALQALQMQNGVTASNYAAQQNQAAMVGSTLGGVLDTVATAYGYPTGGAGAKILGGLGSGSVKPPTMQSPSGGNYSGYGGY